MRRFEQLVTHGSEAVQACGCDVKIPPAASYARRCKPELCTCTMPDVSTSLTTYSNVFSKDMKDINHSRDVLWEVHSRRCRSNVRHGGQGEDLVMQMMS